MEFMYRFTTFAVNAMARLREDEEGQGLVEYALILVLVSIVAIAALQLLGVHVTSVFTQADNALTPATP
jgi:pilus assembly protein Flp/PilA